MMLRRFRVARAWSITLGLVAITALLTALPASADPAWGNYHWARTSNPFTLQLGDNVSSSWDAYLGTTSSDWSVSEVLDTTIVAGGTNPKVCRATSGRVEVCNSTYGRNGWLGLAQIWLSGDHIVQGVAKMNDTYFNTSTYNTPAWKNLVMCQEVGHTLGLGHNDEDFSTTNGTCMDYSNDPVPNQHPNAHDYEQLASIYKHLDSTTTVGALPAAVANAGLDTPAEWGQLVRDSGGVSVYVREFAGGHKVITFVTWAESEHERGRGH